MFGRNSRRGRVGALALGLCVAWAAINGVSMSSASAHGRDHPTGHEKDDARQAWHGVKDETNCGAKDKEKGEEISERAEKSADDKSETPSAGWNKHLQNRSQLAQSKKQYAHGNLKAKANDCRPHGEKAEIGDKSAKKDCGNKKVNGDAMGTNVESKAVVKPEKTDTAGTATTKTASTPSVEPKTEVKAAQLAHTGSNAAPYALYGSMLLLGGVLLLWLGRLVPFLGFHRAGRQQ